MGPLRKGGRDRRRPGPHRCPACAATCSSPLERPEHQADCREAARAGKRRHRPR